MNSKPESKPGGFVSSYLLNLRRQRAASLAPGEAHLRKSQKESKKSNNLVKRETSNLERRM
jgi:hypothetical protein